MDEEHVRGSYEGAKGRLKEGIGSVTGDREFETEGLANRVEGEVRKRAGDIKDAVGMAAASAQEKMRPFTQELEARVKRNPTSSVLIAAGLGLLLGLVSGR